MGRQGVVLFFSTHAVSRLEKALRARGLACKPIRAVRDIAKSA